MYRLILSEKSRDTYYKPLEFLGSYNPYSKELQVKKDRIEYWLSQGSGMSATVNNLLVSEKVIEEKKVRASGINPKKEALKKSKKKDEAEESKKDEVVEKSEESPSQEGQEKPSEQEGGAEEAGGKEEEKKEVSS